MSETVYKALKDGRSPYQRVAWPLPVGRKPGAWMEVAGEPVLCKRGLHGYIHREDAAANGTEVYAMEVAGTVVRDHEKVAASRARLLRRVTVRPRKPKLAVRGLLPCRYCKVPHNGYIVRPNLAPRWASLVDGHGYAPIDVQELAKVPGLVELVRAHFAKVSASVETAQT